MPEKPKPGPKAEDLGGEERPEDWIDYVMPDQLPSCDKGSHKERSIANDQNHIAHWRKVINSFKKPQLPKPKGGE